MEKQSLIQSSSSGKGLLAAILILLLAGLAVGAFLAWKWYAPRDAQLSEIPPRQASSPDVEQQDSSVGLLATIDFETIAQAVEDAEVAEVSGGDTREICREKRRLGVNLRICLNANYTYTAKREGDITVSRQGEGIRVAIPMDVTGEASLTGELARVLGLTHKAVNAKVLALVDLTYGVSPEWCPVVAVNLGYEWLSPATLEVVPGVSLDISSRIETPLEEKLAVVEQKMRDSFECETFHEKLKDIWARRSFPLHLAAPAETGNQAADEVRASLADQSLYATIDPRSLAFSGIQVSDEAMSFAFVLEGLTGVGFEAIATEPRELPPYKETPYERGTISLELPVRAPYSVLGQTLGEALVGQTFEKDTQAGHVSVTPSSIEVYPSSDRIVLGLGFNARIPDAYSDVTGTIYLSGKPVMDDTGRVVTLTDVGFSRILDSDLWSVLSVVFEDRILAAINEKGRIDLNDPLNRAVERIMARVSDPEQTKGITVDLEEPVLSISRLYTDAEDLVAVVNVATSAAVDLPPELLVPRIKERRARMQQQ